MNNKITFLFVASALALAACQKEERNTRPTPPAPAANPQTPAPQGVPVAQQREMGRDLVDKDAQRRQSDVSKMTIHNPDINRSIGLIKRGKIDDILTAGLQVQIKNNIVTDAKFIVSIKGKSDVTTLNFVTSKSISAMGNYEALKLVSGGSGSFAEIRCLKTCENIIAKLRREGQGGELAFVFKVNNVNGVGSGELLIIPGFEQEAIHTSRVFALSRVMEVAFLYIQDLDMSQKLIKSAIEKKSNEQLIAVEKEINAAIEEGLALSGFTLRNAGLEWKLSADQLIVTDRKLLSSVQELTKHVSDNKEVDLAITKINSAREQLPLVLQLMAQGMK